MDGPLINDIAAPLELNISGPEGWNEKTTTRNETAGGLVVEVGKVRWGPGRETLEDHPSGCTGEWLVTSDG